jgi:magnesium transporter
VEIAMRGLAFSFLRDHPDEGAAILEGRPGGEVAPLLAEASTELVGVLLQKMTPASAALCVAELPSERVAAVCQILPSNTLAALLRQMQPETRDRVLVPIPRRVRTGLEQVLRYPEGTAGALMDPQRAPLPQDITVESAIARLRKGEQRSLYYCYVVDREQRLVGVLTVRELLVAGRRDLVAAVMRPSVQRLPAEASSSVILSHPAWRLYHALPVVDSEGRYLGVMRYETVRRLEAEGTPGATPAAAMETAMRLGELVWLGLAGVFAGLTGPTSPTAAMGPEAGRF